MTLHLRGQQVERALQLLTGGEAAAQHGVGDPAGHDAALGLRPEDLLTETDDLESSLA